MDRPPDSLLSGGWWFWPGDVFTICVLLFLLSFLNKLFVRFVITY